MIPSRRSATDHQPRRPRHRKEQIIAAAADQFFRLGYHNVSMEAIASSVGITAGALYRHFRNKQQLLEHTISAALATVSTMFDDDQTDSVDSMLAGLARLAVERRDLGVLWQRESRHLDVQQRRALGSHIRTISESAIGVVRSARMELSPDGAEVLVWAVLGFLTSPSYHSTPLPKIRLEALLRSAGRAVCATSLSAAVPATCRPVSMDMNHGLIPRSRREALLAAATRLFSERGYQAVTVEEIGAAVGISNASVYNHFASKSDLLVATLTRGSDALQLGLSQAMETASTPGEALRGALRFYVRFTLAHTDLVGTLVSEMINLPVEDRRLIRKLERDYVWVWVRLLVTQRPELGEREARFLVQGIFTAVNDVCRIRWLRDRRPLADDLYALCLSLLDAPVHSTSAW